MSPAYRPLKERFYEKVSLPDADGCMLWLAGKNQYGYGLINVFGKSYLAHRFSLEMADGAAPEVDMDAAHGCRNRSCVAPEHLRWATRLENEMDKDADGVRPLGQQHWNSRLTQAQVDSIRDQYSQGSVTQRDLAEKYGVHRVTINDILNRRTWA